MRIKDDGTVHLRVLYQNGRDSWKIKRTKNGKINYYDVSISACNWHVWTADTYNSVSRFVKCRGQLCGACAVFADAWLELGMRGALTVRRVRAFNKSLRSGNGGR